MRRIIAVLLLVLVTGCVSHYRYESTGTVRKAGNGEQPALLYWYADDGRRWTGTPYKQVDTTVGMLLCGSAPGNFDGGQAGEPLVLESRSGDRQVVDEDDQGQLVKLADPRRLPPGSACGYISVEGQKVNSEQLLLDSTPAVLILCDNETRPDRYPEQGAYIFAPVSRTKINKEDGRGAPDGFCNQ